MTAPLSVSHADYFASPGLSWSTLREMANSPLHFRKRREQPIADSDTLRLGRATHTAVLEPHRFLADYVLWEGGRRAGKVWEEFTAVAEAAGKTVVTDDQYTAALEMRDAVRSHPVAAPYLEAGIAERPIYWTDSDTGIACRARPDLISTSRPAVVELKTARSTDARLFGNSAAHLSYHGQLAFYVDGMAAQPGFGVLPAVIIAVEKDSLDVSVFTVDAEDALYAGQALYRELYTYSNSARDMGNCKTHDEFYHHFKFLVGDLLRVTKPGRLCSFHCMNLPTSKSRDGFIGISDFRGILIKAFQDAGWLYHSEVCIWKDPVTAMQRTKALGLLHKQIKKDSCMSRQGIPDYLVTMRKPGTNPEPVAHTAEEFPVETWQRYASPIWVTTRGEDDEGFAVCSGEDDGTDHGTIIPGDTLQKESAREQADERHICPLQLSVIRRALRLWTNPDDVVLSPFAGIGSEGYVALKEGRRFVGVELKRSYYDQAVANCQQAESSGKAQVDMFAPRPAPAPEPTPPPAEKPTEITVAEAMPLVADAIGLAIGLAIGTAKVRRKRGEKRISVVLNGREIETGDEE